MLFEQNGIEVIRLYGGRIITLFLPEEVKAKKNYKEDLFSEIAEIALLLSENPSILGIAESIKIVGEKRLKRKTSRADQQNCRSYWYLKGVAGIAESQ